MKTYTAKPENIKREWLLVDAKGLPLGRLAGAVASLLRGKHKPIFTPHLDTGDFVILVNAGKIELTGRKKEQKVYYSHSGYVGGLKAREFKKVFQENPEFVVRRAVKGMLPHNSLGREMIKKLKVYVGEDHPHLAQKPREIQLNIKEKAGA